MQSRAAQGRAMAGWTPGALAVPHGLLAAPATLPAAAGQQQARQYWRVCHNYDDYAAGQLAYARRTIPTGSPLLSILGMFDVQAERFGDSTGPLQNL